MTKVIRIAGLLIFSLLWAYWSVGAALAQVQPDLGVQVQIPAIETEKPEAILSLAAEQMDRGDAAVALATIAQGLAQYPDDPRLLERQADIYATQPFSWQHQRLLIVVNYGPSQGQGYVRLPFDDLRGGKVMLQDLMSDARYEREGEDLLNRGLYLDLSAWGFPVFAW